MILTTMKDYQRNLDRTREAFETFVRSPLGCHGRRRMNYVRACLCRLVLVERAMLRDAMPIERFESPAIQSEYERALVACGVMDDEVTSKKRPPRAVAFRWAWFTVGRERGMSYIALARSMGRNSHSWLLKIQASMKSGLGRNACLAREYTQRIREALSEDRRGHSDNAGTPRTSGGGAGGQGRATDHPRPVPGLGQRRLDVYRDTGTPESGDMVPGGVAVVPG